MPDTSLSGITDSWRVICGDLFRVLMGSVLVSCHPHVSAPAQAGFAPLRVHRPTRIAVRGEQVIDLACLGTLALVPLPTQAILVAGMFLAVWRVERERLVPPG